MIKAVSVSLPTWRANVGYEEGEAWVMSRLQTGYPRFFIHKSIDALADAIIEKHGLPGEKAMLFPCHAIAARCRDFITRQRKEPETHHARVVDFVPKPSEDMEAGVRKALGLSAVVFHQSDAKIAKSFWQHSGDGVSSRRAEYCLELLKKGLLVDKAAVDDAARTSKGPRRYQKKGSMDINTSSNGTEIVDGEANAISHNHESAQFVEERFGRNLQLGHAANAKIAIRRRIAGALVADVDLEQAMDLERHPEKLREVDGFSEDDVYLYPTGMSSIFNTHRTMLLTRGPHLKSVCFGFPYIDTLKILEKFGPGALFYGQGSSSDLDDLQKRLENGERYLALFCEFPGNPLLKTPDLLRIRRLADAYDFAVVVDETVGTYLNVHVLPYADVVVSSLTKIFSGESNVMGEGSFVPISPVLEPRLAPAN